MDIPRTRDVIIFDKGKTFTVNLSQTMVSQGWKGGQGVQYTTPQYDEPYCTFSNGVGCGFLLWGSNESSDQYTAMTLLMLSAFLLLIGNLLADLALAWADPRVRYA